MRNPQKVTSKGLAWQASKTKMSDYPDWLAGWLADWLTDWLTDWLADWLTDWLTDCLADWLTDWLTDWLASWVGFRKPKKLWDRWRLFLSLEVTMNSGSVYCNMLRINMYWPAICFPTARGNMVRPQILALWFVISTLSYRFLLKPWMMARL